MTTRSTGNRIAVSKELAAKFAYFVAFPLATGLVSCLLAKFLIVGLDPVNAYYTSMFESDPKQAASDLVRDQILIVGTKSDTSQELGEDESVAYIPRRYHGEMAELLDKAGAKGMVLDYFFTESRPENDAKFRASLKKLKHLWVAFGLEPTTLDEQLIRQTGGDPELARLGMRPSAILADGPIPRVHAGSIFALKDQNEHIIGLHPIQRDTESQAPVLHLSFLARHLMSDPHLKSPPQIVGEAIESLGMRIPLTLPMNQAVSIPFPDHPRPFKEVPYSTALNELRDGKYDQFKGRIVLVGLTDGSEDMHRVDEERIIPGVYFVAHALAAFMSAPPADRGSGGAALFGIGILLASLASLGIIQRSRLFQFFIPLALGLLAFTLMPRMISTGTPGPERFFWLLGILIASLGTMLIFAIFERRKDFRASGLEEEAAVMFLDLKDSTRIVAKIGAKEYQRRMVALNEQFAKILAEHGGILERTTGDGFIAIFRGGEPEAEATRCRDCAIAIVRLTESRPELFRDPEILFSIGFEVGPVSGGYVHEGAHRLWSSAGTTVNLAQRIQTFAGQHPYSVFYGPRAHELLGSEQLVEPYSGSLKGFDEELTIYQFRGFKEKTHHGSPI